jgi:hypothetical protein
MARRYDEFSGSAADDGSSLRGALKGWFKHGACRYALFSGLDMPNAKKKVSEDWWYDAVTRPLGAYYRVDPKSIADMHAALDEVGILYTSAGCHTGWDVGLNLKPLKRRPSTIDRIWTIPVQGGHAQHPGHAFAMLGYDERGFLIQNSWGTEWGSYGYAILSYDDWLRNAMDCWVAQLGVVTRDHEEISQSSSIRVDAKTGLVVLAASEVLRNREISPFVIDLGNNGVLSNSGDFRTTPDDVRAIVDVHLAKARTEWSLGSQPIDVCIYAHGGLVSEGDAARIAAQWIPMLYDKKIFPVFLMWETDFVTSLFSLLDDLIKGVPRTTGFSLEKWWNQRLEKGLAKAGTAIWGEMKQNADALSVEKKLPNGNPVPEEQQAGAVLLYQHFKRQAANNPIRLHLVGHSAGSIVAAFMIDRLIGDGLKGFESLSFLAPAVREDTFDRLVRPHLDAGRVKRFQQFHLTDHAEENDPSCGPYRRSLLYLVSESFEGGTQTKILGMQKFFDPYLKTLPVATQNRIRVFASPASNGQDPVASSTHGGFDDDPGTRKRVIEFILQSAAAGAAAPVGAPAPRRAARKKAVAKRKRSA